MCVSSFLDRAGLVRRLETVMLFGNVLGDLNRVSADGLETLYQLLGTVVSHGSSKEIIVRRLAGNASVQDNRKAFASSSLEMAFDGSPQSSHRFVSDRRRMKTGPQPTNNRVPLDRGVSAPHPDDRPAMERPNGFLFLSYQLDDDAATS